jgi:hypothetical protein
VVVEVLHLNLLHNVQKIDKMTFTDLKIYTLNSVSLMLSMTAIEPFLKITLLVVSIGYTLHKWMHIGGKKEENN